MCRYADAVSNAQVRHVTGLDTLPADLTAEHIAARRRSDHGATSSTLS